MALAPDRPGVHAGRNMTQRRNLADLIEVLEAAGEGDDFRRLVHRKSPSLPLRLGPNLSQTLLLQLLSLQCTIFAKIVFSRHRETFNFNLWLCDAVSHFAAHQDYKLRKFGIVARTGTLSIGETVGLPAVRRLGLLPVRETAGGPPRFPFI